MPRIYLVTVAALAVASCSSSSLAFHAPAAPANFVDSTRSHASPAVARRPLVPSLGLSNLLQNRGIVDPSHRAEGLGLRMKDGMDDLSPEEGMIERMVEKLESSLESAIKLEIYEDATTISSELSRMHIDETAAVLQCNSQFYKAFSTKDVELMGKIWLDDPQVQCIHPGCKPLVGYMDILAMWGNMFDVKDRVFKSTDIRPDSIKVHVRGTSAWVMCNEHVTAQGATRKMTATNIFRKYAGKWFIVHHHASQAVRTGGGIEEVLQGSQGSIVRIDGKLGDDFGDGSNMMDEIVRAIRGALDGDDESNHPDIEIVKFGSDESLISGRMIVEDEDSDMWDDDEDDEENGGGIGSSSINLSSFLPSRGGKLVEIDDDDDDDDDDEKRIYERELTRDVTERTVEAIRGLAVKGILSKEQKRRLLSDIVKHHQIGDCASAAEISYQLLVMSFLKPGVVGGGVREDELLDDFAEQCKVMAKRLP